MNSSGESDSPVRHHFVDERGPLGFGWVAGVLGFVALSGLIIWLLPFFTASQMAVILHTMAGLLLTVPLAFWQLGHWLATRKAPRKLRKIAAYIGFWLLAISTASGIVITWQAIFDLAVSHECAKLHLWSSLLALPFVIFHVIPLEKENVPGSGPLPQEVAPDCGNARRQMWKRAAVVVAALCVFLVAASLTYRAPNLNQYHLPASFRPAPGANPFAPSNAQIERNLPVPPEIISNSQACGAPGCHATIYNEWRSSAHRWSEEDQFFQRVRSATTEVQGIKSTEKCGGCHAAVSLFSGYKDPRLGKNTAGYQEGDSCIVCHAVRHVDERGIGSYVLGIPRDYLFDHSGTRCGAFINHFLIRVLPGQHDEDYNLKIVRQAGSCAPCHKEYDVVGKYPGLLEVETQYDDWKHGKWNTDPDPARRLRCQQCHMYIERAGGRDSADPYDIAVGLGVAYHNHRFAAANQFMPLVLSSPGAADQVRDVKKWLSGEQAVPEIQKVWPTGEAVPMAIKAPATARPGAMLDLRALLTNQKAGHSFPTGPLNVVRVWIELDVRDNSGKEIFHSGRLDNENHIEAGSYVLRPMAIAEDGKSIMTPDIWHPKGPIYRPAIPPGQTESFEYKFRVPGLVTGPILVKGRLRYRKANQFFLNAVYPRGHREAPITDISSKIVEIRLTSKRLVKTNPFPAPAAR